MTFVLFLIACEPSASTPQDSESHTGTPADTADSADTAGSGWECEPLVVGSLSPSTWSATGELPAGGVHSLVTSNGGYPLYAAGHSTGAWRAESSGLRWEALNVMIPHTLGDLATSPADAQRLYRSGGGEVERSDDQGESWTGKLLGKPAGGSNEGLSYALAVAPWDADVLWVVMSIGRTWRSDDGAESFSEGGALVDLTVHDSGHPWIDHMWRLLPPAEEGGRLFFSDGQGLWSSTDQGASWLPGFTDTSYALALARDPLDPQHVVIGLASGFAESFDEGESWTLRALDGAARFGGFSWSGTLAFANEEAVYVSGDAGESFTSHPIAPVNLSALGWVEERLVLGVDTGVWASDDLGASFAPYAEGMVDNGMSVVVPHPTCPSRVFAGSRCTGGLYASDDAGYRWSHVPDYLHYVMNVVFDPTDESHLYAVTDDVLLESRDDGESWTELHRQYHYHGFAAHPTEAGRLLMGSVASGSFADSTMSVYGSTDGGHTWTSQSTGLPESDQSAHTIAYWPGDPEVVLLGTYKGGDESHLFGQGVGLYRSADAGQTWAKVELDVLDVAWLTETQNGLAAATDDGLWRSADKGLSWTRAEGGPEGVLLGADFHGDLGLVLGDEGELWRTDDDGGSWRRVDTDVGWIGVQSPLAQVAINANATVAYITVYRTGVYRIAL